MSVPARPMPRCRGVRPLTVTLWVVTLDFRFLPDYPDLIARLYRTRIAARIHDGIPCLRQMFGFRAWDLGLHREPDGLEDDPVGLFEIEMIVFDDETLEEQIQAFHDELRPLGLGVVDVLARSPGTRARPRT